MTDGQRNTALEQATDWRAGRVAALVDERYRRALPMVLTTNVRVGDWEQAFDARTVSRLRGMTFAVELCGVDWRQQLQLKTDTNRPPVPAAADNFIEQSTQLEGQ